MNFGRPDSERWTPAMRARAGHSAWHRWSSLVALGALSIALSACANGGDDDDGAGDSGTDGDATHDESGGTGDGMCGTPEECAAAAEAATALAMKGLLQSRDELHEFMVAMPLGGDLHHHLSGSVYAETFLAWADEGGDYCIEPGELALSTSCGGGNLEVPTQQEDLYLDVVREWSMFEFVPSANESGADHFFATFGKFGAISGTEHGRMLADVRARAGSENVLYIEPMLTSNSTARNLGEDEWEALGGGTLAQSDYAALHDALLTSSGFAAARAKLVDDAVDSEAMAQAELRCDTAQPKQGCDVVTRYQAYISRSGSEPGIFGQMVAAYEAAMVESRIVGLNLVGPEDGSEAMANYDRLMAMLAYLNDYYEGMSPLKLSLHAGEITAEVIPSGYRLDETQHIRKAVEVAGAMRIGHGVDVLFEGDSEGLFQSLAERGILVEICLASNDIILEVSGSKHPVRDYIAHGVPVSLATDDQAVARSSLAAEYVRGAADEQLDYYTLKAMARASLQYSFVQGESLWADAETVAAPCAPAPGDTPVTQPPTPECDAFLAANPRARLQRELEVRFEAFESTYAASQ